MTNSHYNKRYLLPLLPLITYSYGLSAYESAKDYIPEVNYYKFSIGLALMLGIYHGYYRLSKFCFQKDFLMKFTQSQALISEYHSRVLAMTCCSIITLVAIFYHIPNIAPHFFDMETIFNLKLQYFDKFQMYVLFGYLVHDLFWCIKRAKNRNQNIFVSYVTTLILSFIQIYTFQIPTIFLFQSFTSSQWTCSCF